MPNRLAVIRGLQRALKQPRAEIVPLRQPLADDRFDRLLARVAALEKGLSSAAEAQVTVKVVYRNAENLITHVVERVLTEDEWREFEQGLKPDGD